jgi:hypothetical protein
VLDTKLYIASQSINMIESVIKSLFSALVKMYKLLKCFLSGACLVLFIYFLYSRLTALISSDGNYIVISSQGSIHNGSLLHSRLNTQLLTTVHSSSKNLTPV